MVAVGVGVGACAFGQRAKGTDRANRQIEQEQEQRAKSKSGAADQVLGVREVHSRHYDGRYYTGWRLTVIVPAVGPSCRPDGCVPMEAAFRRAGATRPDS